MNFTYSIVITFFEEKNLIFNSLKSVEIQNKKPQEIIFCGPKKCLITCNYIEKFIANSPLNAKIIYLKNDLGPGYARYIGAKNSSARIVMFLDGDDSWKESKALNQLKYMLKTNSIISGTNYYQEHNGRETRFNFKSNITYFDFMISRGLGLSTLAVDRSVAIKYLKNGHYKIAEDFKFIALVLKNENVKAMCLQQALVKYTFNPDGLSRTRLKNLKILYNLYLELEGYFFGTIYFMLFLISRSITGIRRGIVNN